MARNHPWKLFSHWGCSFPTLASVCIYLPPSPIVFFMELLDFPVLWAGSVSAGAGQYLLIKQLTEFHSPSDLQGKNMEILLLLTVYRTLCNSLVWLSDKSPEAEFLDEIRTKFFSSLLFTITSTALLWDFYFFKHTQPLTISTVHWAKLL